jgi:hypothetical protein
MKHDTGNANCRNLWTCHASLCVENERESMTKLDPIYVGDGIYAKFTEWGDLILYLSDGLIDYSHIVLGPEQWSNLVEYVSKHKEGPKV